MIIKSRNEIILTGTQSMSQFGNPSSFTLSERLADALLGGDCFPEETSLGAGSIVSMTCGDSRILGDSESCDGSFELVAVVLQQISNG